MKIIHFGDIHVWRTKMAWDDAFYPKRYIGGINLLLNRRKRFPAVLGEAVVKDILKQEADLVVFSGDMTTASHPEEFSACAELFSPLYEKWKERFFVIPGNHDRYTTKSTKQDWYSRSFPYGTIDLVRSLKLDKNTVVIGIDCSRAFRIRSNGEFTEKIAIKLAQEFEKFKGARVILVGHYPIDYPDSVEIHAQHELLNRAKLKEIVEKYKPALYLHGHKHIRWRIGNAVNCGAAGMLATDSLQQAGYVEVNLGEQIESVTTAHLNKEGKMVRESFLGDF